MVTAVGIQSEVLKAFKELCELDYDAVEAYNKAIEKIENTDYKAKLTEFKHDHQRHIQEITKALIQQGEEAPKGPSAKQWLTKGKVVLADLIGDKTILAAMLTNEMDTNTAYERMTKRDDLWAGAAAIVQAGFADEKRHKAWIESVLK